MFKKFFLSLFIIFPAVSNATTLTAVCTDLSGQRLDYFTENNAGAKNNTFLESKDKMTGSQITLIWDTATKKASFVLPDTILLGGQPHSTELILMYANTKQLTFVGQLNKAPIMFTIYPTEKIAIYSMNTIWPPEVGVGEGIKSTMLHANCAMSIK